MSATNWVLNPSTHEQSEALEAPAGVVLCAGHVLATPVQHQDPGVHSTQGAFLIPVYPETQ
jgi:hypothetical protein